MTRGEDLVELSVAAHVRLSAFVSDLDEVDLRRQLDDGWTVSACLAHMAFWDSWIATRWARFQRTSAFDDLPDVIVDSINEASIPTWLAVTPNEAVALCLSASGVVVRHIRRLPPEALSAAITTNRPQMLDRSRHWDDHLSALGA